MISIYNSQLLAVWILLFSLASSEPGAVHTHTVLKQIANVSYAPEISNPSGSASLFSPRMDFEQWKPLTGRGDPLRNDPTYDYEPPVLERVHYWADETRLEREHYPERKSEVLMLGVSSRRPSVASRQPPLPPRKHYRPPHRYEDFTYKLSDNYPITILVPPPPPPPGHQPSLFILTEEKFPMLKPHIKTTTTNPSLPVTSDTTPAPEHLTSLYSLQEANLIYQSSTTSQNWIFDSNQTKSIQNSAVSSDYAGWGPTTPIDENDVANDSHNLIYNDPTQLTQQPFAFYKPMLSEAPPPPRMTLNPLLLPTFVPTALPPIVLESTTISDNTETTWRPEQTPTGATWRPEQTTTEPSIESYNHYQETKTEQQKTTFQSTPIPKPKQEKNIFDMLGPMMTMPLVNGPERPEDNLYAHASENRNVFKEQNFENDAKILTMQTMQPPPFIKSTESPIINYKKPFHVNPHILNTLLHTKPSMHTHDPYLNMRFTTSMPTIASAIDSFENTKSTTDANSVNTVPMYLIIQGHSKVKTYGSIPKVKDDNDTISNEISKPRETNEVKHLHPTKENKPEKPTEIKRTSRAQNLKSLVDKSLGSIEIQETNVGIKYDISDGSEVPVEIYRKGIVDSDENNYSYSNKNYKEKRTKRQVELEDLLPFDEDTIEEYIYDYLKGKRNETSVTGLIAQAVTSDAAAVVDELEDDDDDEHEDR